MRHHQTKRHPNAVPPAVPSRCAYHISLLPLFEGGGWRPGYTPVYTSSSFRSCRRSVPHVLFVCALHTRPTFRSTRAQYLATATLANPLTPWPTDLSTFCRSAGHSARGATKHNPFGRLGCEPDHEEHGHQAGCCPTPAALCPTLRLNLHNGQNKRHDLNAQSRALLGRHSRGRHRKGRAVCGDGGAKPCDRCRAAPGSLASPAVACSDRHQLLSCCG